jgi:hypothetical protein
MGGKLENFVGWMLVADSGELNGANKNKIQGKGQDAREGKFSYGGRHEKRE